MPLYTFENNEGDTIERLVPVGRETVTVDGVVYLKSCTPQGFAMTGVAVGLPPQKDQVKDGYYQLECSEGARFLKKSTFSTKQIKKAWGF